VDFDRKLNRVGAVLLKQNGALYFHV